MTYTYDGSGRLSTVTDAAGGVTTHTYDSMNRLKTIRDGRNIVFLTNDYDASGRIIRQTMADGGTPLSQRVFSSRDATQIGQVGHMDLTYGRHPAELAAARGRCWASTRSTSIRAAMPTPRCGPAVRGWPCFLHARRSDSPSTPCWRTAARPQRDEVRRLVSLASILGRADEIALARRLLTDRLDPTRAADYLAAYWSFVDDVLRLGTLGIPGYYHGTRRAEHVAARREWLAMADAWGAPIPNNKDAARGILTGGVERTAS